MMENKQDITVNEEQMIQDDQLDGVQGGGIPNGLPEDVEPKRLPRGTKKGNGTVSL